MSIRTTTAVLFLLALSVMAIAHSVFSAFFLYWSYPWIDVPMHLLGGMVVALGFLTYVPLARMRTRRPLLVTLGAVLVVGCAWEVFEFHSGITLTERLPVLDTALDLVCDLLGGMAGYVCVQRIGKRV